jgi:hypothetical protein
MPAGAGGVAGLLRGTPGVVRDWTEGWNSHRVAASLGTVVLGTGLYGAAMGWWRGPSQALFVAIKFPLIILLTTGGNALLNAMLAPLLGMNIGLRQSLLAVLASFTIASAILGAFAPLAAFVAWNTPPLPARAEFSGISYNGVQLMHVGVIAFAGVVANARLLGLLREIGGGAAVAWRVLLSWLAGNLFLGSQLSWIMRPFIGSPILPVEFLRQDAFAGNFYESVYHSVVRVLHSM